MIRPDARGFYRCPYRCGDPMYPQPKWKTLKGIEGHLEKCKAKADDTPLPTPQPRPPLVDDPVVHFGDCAECGEPIFTGESIWHLPGRLVCVRPSCFEPHRERGTGSLWWAGLHLEGLDSDFAG